MTRTATLTLAALALVATACGDQGPVELDVAPAGTVEEVTPEPLEEAVPAPATQVDGDDEVADHEVADDEVADDAAAEPRTGTESAPTPSSSTGSTAQPTPPPADPELVIGEDGCVTDVATGLVVTCHDPAAGPDDES